VSWLCSAGMPWIAQAILLSAALAFLVLVRGTRRVGSQIVFVGTS